MNKYFWVLTFFLATPAWAQKQTPVQVDYTFLNVIASCRTVNCVVGHENRAKGKVEGTVLYAKWMLLDKSNRAASQGLLENLPTTNEELMALMTLSDWHEGVTSSTAEMKRLASIYDQWPRLLSVAVRQFPRYLAAYVRFGRLAINDMHSDYTKHERSVCRADQKKFITSFVTLTQDDQEYIRKHVFNPNTCEPVFVGEAE